MSRQSITLFSIPKPFRGLADVQQRNAIESWLALDSRPRILLMGDDHGVHEVSREYGVEHIPDVRKNEFGTPLLGSAFQLAAERAAGGLLGYVNADIILPPDTCARATSVSRRSFVMVCQRHDVEVRDRLGFASETRASTFAGLAKSASPDARPTAIDLFLFSNIPAHTAIPDFAVGRQGWDNWFLYNAWRHRIPIIDASPVLNIYHQKHDYGHIPQSTGTGTWGGPESDQNTALAGGYECMFDIRDATHMLTSKGVTAARGGEYLARRVERLRQKRPLLFRSLGLWRLRYALCCCFPRI